MPDEDQALSERIGRAAAAVMRFPFEGPVPFFFPSSEARIANTAVSVAIGAGALRRAGLPLKQAVATAALVEAGQRSMADDVERAFLRSFGITPFR